MPGPNRRPVTLRAAALLVAAVLLFGACTAATDRAARTQSPPGVDVPSAEPGATTGSGPASTSPRPPQSSKPARRATVAGPFRFRVASVGHLTTIRHMASARFRRASRRTAAAIRRRFDTLFRITYVDPAHWRTGRYGEAFLTCFGGQARAVARARQRKLTLGPDAGKLFESVRDPAGRLFVRLLIGATGGVATVLVRATFNEKAVRTDGRTTVIVVDGRYYLTPSKHGWVIDGFRVGRHDHAL